MTAAASLATLTGRALPEPEHAPLPPFRIGESPGRGRGLFAARPIRAGECLQCAPVVVIPAADVERVAGTILEFYVFDWNDGAWAVVLGTGSLLNHSYRPNVVYTKSFEDRTVTFVALRDVAEGEELFVNYNGDPDDRTPLWYRTTEDG